MVTVDRSDLAALAAAMQPLVDMAQQPDPFTPAAERDDDEPDSEHTDEHTDTDRPQ